MTTETIALLIGIDVGTSGVRAVAADPSGSVVADAEQALCSHREDAEALHEQNPADWWAAVCASTRKIMGTLAATHPRIDLAGIAVTSTSGSLVVTDAHGEPLRPAILYDDGRGSIIAQKLNRQVKPGSASLNPSYSLVKAAWIQQQEPTVWDRTCHLLHPADWLVGKLTGEFGVSDYSNALKLGYEPEERKWSEAVNLANVPSEWLPVVVRPGQQVGILSPRASSQTGLVAGIPVLAGATDGMASLIACGAYQPCHANTTLGTTLVWKVLAKTKPGLAPGIYCHLHPSALWAPGAASNTGPGSLRPNDPGLTPSEMDRLAVPHLPTTVVCYLLPSQGERFPFVNALAKSFLEGEAHGPGEWYAAQLQSLSFVERWGYEVLEKCGVEVGEVVYSAGGAARSPILSKLRAEVLNRAVVRCRYPTSAFGAAILAASDTIYRRDIQQAIRTMTSPSETATPSGDFKEQFTEIYGLFRQACARRGYS